MFYNGQMKAKMNDAKKRRAVSVECQLTVELRFGFLFFDCFKFQRLQTHSHNSKSNAKVTNHQEETLYDISNGCKII